MLIYAKIVRIAKHPEHGPLYETLYLRGGSAEHDFTFVREERDAAVWPWEAADKLAARIGDCHAVVIAGRTETGRAESAVQRARQPVPEQIVHAREDRAAENAEHAAHYHEELDRRYR
jgi:hypothetical protein